MKVRLRFVHFLSILLIASTASSNAFVGLAINYGSPSAEEQSALDKINRFRANPTSELAAMFSESFAGSYTNSEIQALLQGQDHTDDFWRNTFGNNIVSNSMDFFQTRPGTVYDQFQALSPASSPLTWNANLGWSAHQYSIWVELDGGSTNNPHFIPGAPNFSDRFTNAGVTWTSIGENIAANWPMNVNQIHMGYVIDWGFGFDGIQSPPGHRESMLSNAFNQVGISFVDAGWDPGSISNVQHLANVTGSNPIAFGFVFDANGQRQSGVTVELRDAMDQLIGTTTTDAIGAYTYILTGAGTPVSAIYSDGIVTSPALTLDSDGVNYFMDIQMIPEPSSTLFTMIACSVLALRRKRF